MRTILAVLLVFIFFGAFSQKRKSRKVHWTQWYDSAAFFNGPEPLILGYGEKSDSLSTVFGGRTIFEYEDQYYLINCLADYYLWFTSKYSYLFRKDVSLYEELYYDGKGLHMASFVKRNYKGKKLPVNFRLPYSPEAYYGSSQPGNSGQGSTAPPTVQRFYKN